MAGIMDLFGGGSGGMFGDLLTPQQQQALAQRSLLGFLAGMQKSGALDYTAPFISGKVPAGFAAGLAGGMAGMGEAQDTGALTALKGAQLAQQAADLKSQAAVRDAMLKDSGELGAALQKFLMGDPGVAGAAALAPATAALPAVRSGGSLGGGLAAGGALTPAQSWLNDNLPGMTRATGGAPPINQIALANIDRPPLSAEAGPGTGVPTPSFADSIPPPGGRLPSPALGGRMVAGGALVPALGKAVETVESGGDPGAVSPKGAVGLRQIMPATAAGYGVSKEALRNPVMNTQLGDKILADNLARYNGDIDAALIAYNAGPGRADQFLAAGRDMRVLPKETQQYVPKVKAQLAAITGGSPDTVVAQPQQARGPLSPAPSPAAPSVPQATADPKAAFLQALMLRLAQQNARAEMLKMGSPYASMIGVLEKSPQFQAALTRSRAAAEDPFKRGLTTHAADEDIRKAWNTPTDLQKGLVGMGIDPNSPQGRDIQLRAFPDTRPEAVKLADAIPLTGDMRSGVLAGAIPGNAPTPAQREMPILLGGTEAEKNAYREAKKLSNPQTTINNVTDPIAAGIGKSFVEQRESATNASRIIEGVHRAKALVDQGIISGPGAAPRVFLERVGELFGLPAEKAANTAAFKATIGEQVLAMVKGLGAGAGISNADRDFAERMAGGQEELGESAIRQILDIREKAERAKIRAYSGQAARLLENAPETLKGIAPLLQIDEPPEYRRPEGAASVVPQGAEQVGTYQGKPVFRMPDGSMKVLQ